MLLSWASNGVEQHPDVEMVYGVPRKTPAEKVFTLRECAQSSSSAEEENVIATVDLTASDADVADFTREPKAIQKLNCDSYTAVKSEPQNGQIEEVP